NSVGFEAGLKKIIESLDAGNPVIIDTNIPPHGHTVLVNGYDPQRKLISIVDPLIASPGLRRLNYVEFERVWRSLTADIRGVIITSAPKQR
ncbi:MAG: C39 family peptidase, partial [Planctomycetota bacterium]